MDSLLSSYSSVIVILATLLLIILSSNYFLNKSKLSKVKKLAPEPTGAWPIVGHLPLFSSQVLYKKMGELADKYGPIFALRLGRHSTIVVSSWEVAKELFTVNDLVASSRPKTVSSELFSYNFAMFGLAPYDNYWREVRKITTLELLSNRRLDLLKHVRLDEVLTSLKELNEMCLNGAKVELKEWIVNLNLNVICKLIAGKRCFGTTSESDREVAERWRNAVKGFFRYAGLPVVRDVAPFLGWLDIGGHEKEMRRTSKELDAILEEWLEEHKNNKNSSEAHKDFMDIMLSVLGDTKIGRFDADTINKSTCLSLLIASDTTATTLVWALSLLLNKQQALKKAKEELELCVGNERLVSDADISKLVYLQAIVKETLRLYPPAPLMPPRQFTQECTLNGYYIPKDTVLILNIAKLQTDPRVWPNPMEFMPERFLTTHKNVDVKGSYELVPFGGGRRQCPGLNLGLQMVNLVLATLLQAFEISTPGNEAVDMTETTGITNLKATPLYVILTPRLPPHVFP